MLKFFQVLQYISKDLFFAIYMQRLKNIHHIPNTCEINKFYYPGYYPDIIPIFFGNLPNETNFAWSFQNQSTHATRGYGRCSAAVALRLLYCCWLLVVLCLSSFLAAFLNQAFIWSVICWPWFGIYSSCVASPNRFICTSSIRAPIIIDYTVRTLWKGLNQRVWWHTKQTNI